MEKLQNLNNLQSPSNSDNYFKQASDLLRELDELIERDYQEALSMLENFKNGTLIIKEEFTETSLDNNEELNIFEDSLPSKYYEYANR